MPSIPYFTARFSRGLAIGLVLAVLVLGAVLATPFTGIAQVRGDGPGPIGGRPGSGVSATTPLDPGSASPTWSWRDLGERGWSPWRELATTAPLELVEGTSPGELIEALGLATAPGTRAVEMRARQLGEAGTRQRVVLWTAESTLPKRARLEAAADPGKRANASVQGRLLYLDRVYDLQGYTGAVRRLPLRRVGIELVRSGDDSLMVAGSTDDEGWFLLEYDAVQPEDLDLRLRSQVEGYPGLAPRVLDSVGPGGDLSGASLLRYLVLEIVGMGPGSSMNIGEQDLQPDGAGNTLAAFNLLDCLLDVGEMLGTSSWLGSPPDSLPPIIWSPSAVQLNTRYQDGVVEVASPGGGDDDSWADARVLAAVGEWYLQRYSRTDTAAGIGAWNLASDPRLAFQKGAAAVFAGLVRQHRAVTRLDADGLPVDARVSTQVDLGFPPPLGFSGLAQDGFDLETRELSFGGAAEPRGQSSVANVAAMLWDLVDDEDTPDGMAGDDDPRRATLDDGAARFHLHASISLPALPMGEAITYEDFHAAWLAAHGESAALDSIAVTVGRTALFTDSHEDDSDPLVGPLVVPWVQPEPQPGGGVVISELHLGDRDWVELSNRGTVPVSVGGWRVVARRNGFSTGPERETLLPLGRSIAAGRSLVIFEGGEALDNDALALHDPAWNVPWRESEDGACILYDDGGAAVDFVRWDAAGEANAEPVPPGQSFGGSLPSPAFGLGLSRDSLATDTDQAGDFTATDPNPYAPNAGFLQLHSLYPAGESDHLRLDLAPDSLLWVLATAEREAPEPSLTLLDLSGQPVLVEPPRAGDPLSARLEWTPPVGETRSVRLTQDAAPLIATAVRWGAWIPWNSNALLPVSGFVANPRDDDPELDTVDLSWTNTSSYDQLKLFVDGALHSTLNGSAQSSLLVLAHGHHFLELEPELGGVSGERSATGVFVGITPRFSGSGFELGDSSIFDYQGFTELEESSAGGRAVLDHADPAVSYPPNDEAWAELRDPVVLTSSSVLRFRHAAHLAPDADRAYVEITLDDGVGWETLAVFQGSDHTGGGDPADWTDLQLSVGDWVEEELDLSVYAGSRARIRFRRVSDASGGSLGWILDDIFFGSPLDGRIWVTVDGDDLFGCGHAERPFASPPRGLASALYGDTLRIGAGSFSQTSQLDLDGSPRPVNLALPPGVSVRGEGLGQTIVAISGLGTGVYAGPASGWSAADSARVTGLTLLSGSRGLRVDEGMVRAEDLHLGSNGTGILVGGGELSAQRILLTGSGRAARQEGGRLFLLQATFSGMDRGLLVQSGADSTRVENCIFTRITQTALEVEALAPLPGIACNDFHGFSGSPEVFLGIPDPIGQDGNVAIPVQFCDLAGGDYSLAQGDPLLALPGCGALGAFGEGCPASAVDAPARLGLTRLLGNHPNPFNPRTRISFVLAREGEVRLTLYDARGRRVRELLAGELVAGEHHVDWDATDAQGRRVASGVYHLELRADGQRFTTSMALLK